MNEDEKVNIHAALEMFTSGQLRFLGSTPKIFRKPFCNPTALKSSTPMSS
jgi:hypothetical protein